MKTLFAVDLRASVENPEYDGTNCSHEYLGVTQSREQTVANIEEVVKQATANGIPVLNILPSKQSDTTSFLQGFEIFEKGHRTSGFDDHNLVDWYCQNKPDETLVLGFSYQCCVGDTILAGLNFGKIAYSRDLCLRRPSCKYNEPMKSHENLIYLPTMDEVRNFLN